MDDLQDIVKKRLIEGGCQNVFEALPDGRRFPECIVLSWGLPRHRQIDYAGTEQVIQPLTVIVKRLSDPAAKNDAVQAREVLLAADLSCDDGSFDYIGIDIEPPRPMAWNESGRYVWALDSEITTQRKDF